MVDRAADHVAAADHRARTSPVLGAIAHLPLVGGQIGALRDLTGATSAIAEEGRGVAQRLGDVVDEPSGAAGRLDLATTAADELDGLAAFLDGVDIGAHGWLVPPLAWARDDLQVTLIETRADLRQAAEASGALTQFLTGPHRYLIAAGNNAEMRSGGVVTATGVVEVADADFEMGDFLPNDNAVASPVPVPVPDEWREIYGWRSGEYRYPGTTYSPNFPVAAQIMSEISARNAHGPVDGVIYVDAFTLTAVLRVVGPVTVDGVEYNAENTIGKLLYFNYLEFGTAEVNDQRKDLQGQVAEAAFEQIDSGDYSVFALASALADMAEQRHLLAWSSDPTLQDLWEILGVDGHLEADDLFVEVANIGSSKLDFFVTVGVDLETELDEEQGVRHGHLAVTITNIPRQRTSPYIEGFSRAIEEPGEHIAWVLFYLPQYATGMRPVDFPAFTQQGPDGPLVVSATSVLVPEGESRTLTIDFEIPADQYRLSVLPSARITPTAWTIDGNGPFYDYVAFDYDLETGDTTPSDRTGG